MKKIIICLTLLSSISSFAGSNALDKLLERVSTTSDSRITMDVNKNYLLEGINPEDGSKCEILVSKYVHRNSERPDSYDIGIRDMNPNTQRVNNPLINIDIRSFHASSGGAESRIVSSSESSIEVKSAYSIPSWASDSQGARLTYTEDTVTVRSYFSGGLFSHGGKFNKIQTQEDYDKFFYPNHTRTLVDLRPSDSIKCNFQF